MLAKLRRYPLVPLLAGLSLAIWAPYALATTIGTNLTLSGLMTVPAGYSLDAASSGDLNIGTTTATTINIGGTQATTKVLGILQVPPAYGLDVSSAGALNIGTTTANAITIGKSGVITTVRGLLNSGSNASTTLLSIGGSTGTTLNTVQTGSCTLSSVSISATSTGFTTCSSAGTVDNTYKVIVTPTDSSLTAGFWVASASTTASSGVLSFRVINLSGATNNTGAATITFWAFK